MNAASHLALVRRGHELRLETLPTPTAGPGDVLVAVERVGICGTDLQILNGSRPGTAAVLGHEGIGRIERIGGGVTHLGIGDRVVFNPVNPACPDEVLGHSFDGLLQEKVLVSARMMEAMVLPADEDLSPVLAPLTEPLGTAIYGHELVAAACNPVRVAVIGGGPVGLLYAIHARAAGASVVYLVHTSAGRLNWAQKSGIIGPHEAILVDDREPNLSSEVDAVYLCTTRAGAAAGMRLAMKLVRDGGCIDLVAGFPVQDASGVVPGVDLNDIRRRNVCGEVQGERHQQVEAASGKRIWITGHRGTSSIHLKKAMRRLALKPIEFDRLITDEVPLLGAAELITEMSRGIPPADRHQRVKVTVTLRG